MSSRIARKIRDLLSSFTLRLSHPRYQVLEFFDSRTYFQRRQPAFRVQYPVVSLPQTTNGRRPQTKSFPQESLGTISLDRVSQCLARSCNTESVMRQVVGQDKRGHQCTFITFALPINFLEIVAAAQIRLHALSHI